MYTEEKHKIIREFDFGLALRKFRVKLGYSQQMVANHLEISLTAYKKWEKKQIILIFYNYKK